MEEANRRSLSTALISARTPSGHGESGEPMRTVTATAVLYEAVPVIAHRVA